MNRIIFAGGKGTRMGEQIQLLPKQMVQIDNKQPAVLLLLRESFYDDYFYILAALDQSPVFAQELASAGTYL